MNSKHKRLLAGILACLMLCMFAAPARVWADEAEDTSAAEQTVEENTSEQEETAETLPEETIHIASAEELLNFAESCTLDTWSQNKRVVLDCDISLEGVDFEPIPSFGGTFVGGGHTIRGLRVSGSFSPAGLFAVVQEGGILRNLNVEGSVAPDVDSDCVGGIAGENRGLISNCSFTGSVSGTRSVGGVAGKNAASAIIRSSGASGTVFGENMTGGVAGYNLGYIGSCRNSAFVNIESTDPGVDITSIDLDFSMDLTRLSQADTANIATDTGGIAGYSSGTIMDCANLAAIGHQHIGYNVGGIAGRSCGQIRGCTNEGSACGRKDVGGIAGQLEPYIRVELSESTRSQVEQQLQELNDLVDKAADDAEGGSGGISARLNSLSGSVGNAVDRVNDVKVTAGIDTTVRGDGSLDSGTQIGGEVNPIDADASHGSGGGLTITTEPGSVSVGIGHGSGGSLEIGSSASAGIDHSGTASGALDASTQIVAAPDLGGLTSAVNGIGSQLTMLNQAVTGTVGTLAEDVRQINDKFAEVSETLFNAVDELQNGTNDLITDVSTVDVDQITLGKTSCSSNSGTVYGDINSGGIAGSMAIEYELDPEDDASNELSDDARRQYEYRAVIQNCTNTGEVTSKRSYAGGICGRMDLGLITDCKGYGTIRSEDGNYVGGIAGVTGATVRTSYAKCTLSGQKYVGGIVGSGVTQKVSGSGSTVAGCYSMVEIEDCTQYSGAISGADAGTFLENYYVSDTLAGINRQSYSGQAEPSTYKEMLKTQALPEEMRQLTLRFVADGEEIFSTHFSYGASFDAENFPSIPEKEGYLASWDHETLENLHFDTTVTAVYTAYTPSLASSAAREDGRAIMLVEGDYSDDDVITITAEPLTPGAFHIRAGSLQSRIDGYFSTFGTSEFSLLKTNWEVVEQWSIEVPGGDSGEHRLRYLAPDGGTKFLRVYMENNGSWERVEYETAGSYLVIPVRGSSVRIAVVSTVEVWWVWAAAVLLLALIIFLIVHFTRRAARKLRKRKEGAPEEMTVPEAEPNTVAQAAAPSEPDPELLARALSAEERLARAEEELRMLRESSASGAVAVAERPKKRVRWWIPVIVVVVLLAIAAGVFFVSRNFGTELEAYRILNAYVQKDPLAMTLRVDAELDGQAIGLDAEICKTKVEGKTVTCLQREGVQLFYAGETVYLENGRAFSVGGDYPDYAELLPQAAELYRLVNVSASTSGTQKTYRLTAKDENADALVRILLQELPADSTVRTFEAALTADGQKPIRLTFSAELTGGTPATLNAELSFSEGVTTAPEIPGAVRSAITSGKPAEAGLLTDELFELLKGWAARCAGESMSADLTLSADCGPVVVNDTLQIDQKRVSGQSITAVRKNALTLYLSGDRLCDGSGNAASDQLSGLADSAELIDAAYQLLLNGETSCTISGDTKTYTLSLDEKEMENLAYAIAPEAKSQSITFKEGTLEAVLTGGVLTSLRVSCAGSIRVVLADTPVSLSAAAAFTERDVEVPQEVVDALVK